MSGMSVRVRWYREAWHVFAQSPHIRNASGKLKRRIGPSDTDREKAEHIAGALRRQLGEIVVKLARHIHEEIARPYVSEIDDDP